MKCDVSNLNIESEMVETLRQKQAVKPCIFRSEAQTACASFLKKGTSPAVDTGLSMAPTCNTQTESKSERLPA